MNEWVSRRVIIKVAEKMLAGKSVVLRRAIIDAYGSDENFAEAVVSRALDKFESEIEKEFHDASAEALLANSTKMFIPGMEYVQMPNNVFGKDPETGASISIPFDEATFGQIRSDLKTQLRRLRAKMSVAETRVAAVERLEELGVPDDMTGAEIKAKFADPDGEEESEAEQSEANSDEVLDFE